MFASKNSDIIKSQAFVKDVFDIIAQVHTVEWHNGYKKILQQVKNEVYGISQDDINGY